MNIKKELVQFTIKNETGCDFNLPLFQDNVYSINAETKYSWDITSESLACGSATIVINSITYNLSFAGNLTAFLAALNALSFGFFCTETVGGSTYLYTVDDTNIYGNLDICPGATTTTTTSTTTGSPTTSTTTSTTTAAETSTTTTTSTTTAAETSTTTTTSTTTAAETSTTTTTSTTTAPETSTTTTTSTTTAAETSTTTTTSTTTAPETSTTTTTSTTTAPETSTTTTTSTTTAPETSTTTTTSTTTLGSNFFATNSGGSGSIADVDDGSGGYFYTVDVGSYPLTTGQQLEGTHGSYTGVIRVNISSNAAASCLILYINNVIVETIGVPSSGFYTFSSVTISSSDLVEVEYILGSCPP